MSQHMLKTWTNPFQAVWMGHKVHEVRINDRNFQVGDTLVLKEFDPEKNWYSSREIDVEVTYITPGGNFGLPSELCVMSIRVKEKRMSPEERKRRVHEWLLKMDDVEIPACEFCGRVVLAGWCCKAALKKAALMARNKPVTTQQLLRYNWLGKQGCEDWSDWWDRKWRHAVCAVFGHSKKRIIKMDAPDGICSRCRTVLPKAQS